MTVRNVGRSTWTREAGYALAPLADAALLSPGRVPLPSGRPVATGETATFTFFVTAPREGPFLAQWRLVTEEGTQFGPVISRTVVTSGTCPVPPDALGHGRAGRDRAGGVPGGVRLEPSEGAGASATRFRVQLGTVPPFGAITPIVDREVSGSTFAWNVPAAVGTTIGFRVAAVNGCGSTGAFSPLVLLLRRDAPRPRSSRLEGRERPGSSGRVTRRRRRSSRSETSGARPRRFASVPRRARSR